MDKILTKAEAMEWLRLNDDDPVIDSLIQVAYDTAEGSVSDFALKVKSPKFQRKLKLFMLNYIVSAYDQRGIDITYTGSSLKRGEGNLMGRMQFVNATLLMQLQYGSYTETDI